MTINEYRKEFHKIYHSAIVYMFKKYEKERKIELLTLITFVSMFLFLILIFYNGAVDIDTKNSSVTINLMNTTLVIGSFIGIFALPWYLNNKFVSKFKNECMPQILKLFGDITWFKGSLLIDDTELCNSDLFYEYNRYTADDSFLGNYKGVNFEISEMNLRRGYLPNIFRGYDTFKGVVIKFDANKLIHNKTIVATREDLLLKNHGLYQIGWVICWVSYVMVIIKCILSGCYVFVSMLTIFPILALLYRKKEPEVLNEIKLEDPEFGKKYKAYSSDQVEGRYLITTAFMDRFKNIQTAFGTNKIKCSFYDSNLMFAISTNKNLFEIGNLFYSLENPKQLETFFNELTSIYMMVDYFKLNETTGL